jgi:tripartite-type tricarboxylate transporter receptor subunit TctC
MKRLLLAALALPLVAQAQTFPAKPIHLVAPYAAGGAMDLTARSVAAVMSESIGQQVVVENRTGAGGLVGTDYVARAAPDGYTLLMYADANAIAPAIYKKLNHDPVKDFAPITNTILGTHLIVGHPSVPADTLKELIALAKKGGSNLTFGSPGTGTPQHLAGELFKQQAGKLDITHVPYRGGGQLIVDLVGGQVPLIARASCLSSWKRSTVSATGWMSPAASCNWSRATGRSMRRSRTRRAAGWP